MIASIICDLRNKFQAKVTIFAKYKEKIILKKKQAQKRNIFAYKTTVKTQLRLQNKNVRVISYLLLWKIAFAKINKRKRYRFCCNLYRKRHLIRSSYTIRSAQTIYNRKILCNMLCETFCPKMVCCNTSANLMNEMSQQPSSSESANGQSI